MTAVATVAVAVAEDAAAVLVVAEICSRHRTPSRDASDRALHDHQPTADSLRRHMTAL